MKKTKIICSVGPACNNVEIMEDMVYNGMSCARINLSHAVEDEILNVAIPYFSQIATRDKFGY